MYLFLVYQKPDIELASTTCKAIEADGYQVWVRDPDLDWNTPANARLMTVVSKSCDAVVIVAPNGIREDEQLAQFLNTVRQFSQNIFVIRSAQEIHAFLAHLRTIVPERTERPPLPILKGSSHLTEKNGQSSGQYRRNVFVIVLLLVIIIVVLIVSIVASGMELFPSPPAASLTPTLIPTLTASASATLTQTASPTGTATPTSTSSSTATLTPTASPTDTATLTQTASATNTATPTQTVSATSIPPASPSATVTASRTMPTATPAIIFVTNTPHVDATSTIRP
jgi:flagellar hook-length control protein FliK